MKIIEVVVHYEITCCTECDGPGYYTYGYYTPDYDMKKVILSILNKNQDWDLEQIQMYEVPMNTPSDDIKKEITDKYIKYDENTYEYELCD